MVFYKLSLKGYFMLVYLYCELWVCCNKVFFYLPKSSRRWSRYLLVRLLSFSLFFFFQYQMRYGAKNILTCSYKHFSWKSKLCYWVITSNHPQMETKLWLRQFFFNFSPPHTSYKPLDFLMFYSKHFFTWNNHHNTLRIAFQHKNSMKLIYN